MARHLISSDFKQAQAWSALVPGDIVDVIAPGSASPTADLLGGIKFIQSLGLVPRYSKDLFSGKTPILSHSDEYRFRALKKALIAKDSKAVWCTRGGYGSLRLLPQLTKMKQPEKSKLLMGYSDISSIHSFLNFFWQWSSLHAPVLDRFGAGRNTPAEAKAIKDLLFGKKREVVFNSLKPLNAAAKKKKLIKSALVGGNLAVLQSSLGTPWQMNPDGKILFLEDIGEKAHRVDRMLVQLHQSGYLSRAKALVLGDFIYTDKVSERLIWNLAIKPFAESLKIPVLRGLPCGHGARNMPLPFLTPTRLLLGRDRSQLIVETGFQSASKA